jgi:EAL domain-containing protein (putative c-di-GMP-specific phosphodiesterase class I)/GGDEF domain-containing protein
MSSLPRSTYAALTLRTVRDLIEHRALAAHFQPIVELATGQVHAHEALVRGPAGSALATPDALFAAAQREGATLDLEIECVRCALAAWGGAGARGKLFINLSAGALVQVLAGHSLEQILQSVTRHGVPPSSVVIELTEHERVTDHEALIAATTQLRRCGIGLAIDDFGDGRSSLRLWSELRPELVKIDKYFSKELPLSSDKLQTWRALLQIAETLGARLVAEGLETSEELRLVRDLGVALGQGWVLGRPAPAPVDLPLPGACEVLRSRDIAVFPELKRASNGGLTASRLLITAASVTPDTSHDDVMEVFRQSESLPALAIVDGSTPVGLISRSSFIARYAKPFFKELYGRKPCTLYASLNPVTVEIHTGMAELTSVLTSSDQRYLTDGFVITEGGHYRGVGTGEQLVRAVTESRIEAARHANPLTFLPGNIPISDHIGRLLASGRDFVAAYADLNHFKPFNDHYGYWRGDEMIRLVARVVVSHCDATRDFVGHVGGDDFMMLFQSADWEDRCERIVASFDALARELFDAEALAEGGIHAEDRHGVMRFHPCTTLCIGAVRVPPGRHGLAEDVANAAAAAKRAAKHGAHSLMVLDADSPSTVY